MILATAVLLFQLPASAAPASLANRPIRATRVVFAAISTSATSASPASNGANTTAAAAARNRTSPVQPPIAAEGNPPVAEPIIHSVVPPTGSIAPLTGPSFSEAILPPPAFRPPHELRGTHRRLWLFLSTAEHSAATYDAWSTRRALAAGRIEADPLMRPFAGSAALYPAMQLVPIGLDYLARRLQRSSGWAHRIWWVPQSAATVTFLFSGSYNVAHTN